MNFILCSFLLLLKFSVVRLNMVTNEEKNIHDFDWVSLGLIYGTYVISESYPRMANSSWCNVTLNDLRLILLA